MKTQRFRVGPEPMTEKETRRWLDAQMPYPNLAGNEDIANRAMEYVKHCAQRFDDHSHEIRDKWRTLDFMLRGNTLSQIFQNSDIHVPLLYTAVEHLVPMLVDSLTNLEPWFEVQGRDRNDRMRAKKIQSWLRYQSDLTKLPERMEEIARVFVIYQFVAMKSWWDVKHREQVVKNVERTVEAGLPVYTFTPERGTVQYYEGNCFDIVDPYLFFCDTRQTDAQKMQFIGDRFYISEEELIRRGRTGRYMNVEEARKQLGDVAGTQATALGVRSEQAARSLGSSSVFSDGGRHSKGQPGYAEVVEMWCTWQATDDADFKEWVITVCGNTVLRVQENPHDDKHRPYAIARSSKEPFDFFNVGVLDQAIRLNIEVDDHRNLARKSHALALCPTTFVGADADMPDNLFDIDVGQVFRTSQPPTFAKVPSTVAEMIPFEQVLRRDIEQATGSFGAFEGGTDSNTATEYERKVQLRNLRSRRLVFAFADGLTELLRQFYANTRQFVTQRKTFRVLGADARDLGIDYEIRPEDFADPVDIILTGPKRLQSYGLRATQVTSFLQQFAPLLPMLVQNGELNVSELAREMWTSIVGYRMGDEILAQSKSADGAIPAEDENMALLQGGSAEVHPLDDDREHMRAHDAVMAETDDMEILERVAKHKAAHIQQAQQKAARARAQEQPPTGPFNSGQALAARHAPAEGREFQRTPDLAGDVARQTPPGETPGPPRMGAMGAPDREPATPQTQNR